MSAVMENTTASDLMRRRGRLFMVGAFVVAGIAFAVIAGSGINENLVYYWTPTDLQNAGDTVFGVDCCWCSEFHHFTEK